VSHEIFPEQGAYHSAVVRLEHVDAFECMAGKSFEVIAKSLRWPRTPKPSRTKLVQRQTEGGSYVS
jgi:hypothetical protein